MAASWPSRSTSIHLLEILETFVMGKEGVEDRCEDAVVCTTEHVALIDGATTERGHEIATRSPGRFAMEALSAAIRELDRDADAASAIDQLSQALGEALDEQGVERGSFASACVLIASAQRREVWRVGNSTFVIDGKRYMQHWAVAEIPALMRSAYLRALLRAGATTVEDVQLSDPAAELVAPLLRVERVFRNATDAGELAYAALDGLEMPPSLIEQVRIPSGATVVFASDGYPLVAPTLAETESYLQQSLAEDPLRIHQHAEVRGVSRGRVSYDDRSYVRFRAR
jgi:hypothetical protein